MSVIPPPSPPFPPPGNAVHQVMAELKQGNDLLTSMNNRKTNAADELESLGQARESYISRLCCSLG